MHIEATENIQDPPETVSNIRRLSESRPYSRLNRQKPRRWLFSAGNQPKSGTWITEFDHPELGSLQLLQFRVELFKLLLFRSVNVYVHMAPSAGHLMSILGISELRYMA